MEQLFCYVRNELFLLGLFMSLDVLVDALSSSSTSAHSQDNGGSTAHGIAASEDTVAGSHGVVVNLQTAKAFRLQTRSGALDEGVGTCAQSHDNRIDRHLKFASFDGAGLLTALFIGFAQLHLHAAHSCNIAILITNKLDGVGEEVGGLGGV